MICIVCERQSACALALCVNAFSMQIGTSQQHKRRNGTHHEQHTFVKTQRIRPKWERNRICTHCMDFLYPYSAFVSYENCSFFRSAVRSFVCGWSMDDFVCELWTWIVYGYEKQFRTFLLLAVHKNAYQFQIWPVCHGNSIVCTYWMCIHHIRYCFWSICEYKWTGLLLWNFAHETFSPPSTSILPILCNKRF